MERERKRFSQHSKGALVFRAEWFLEVPRELRGGELLAGGRGARGVAADAAAAPALPRARAAGHRRRGARAAADAHLGGWRPGARRRSRGARDEILPAAPAARSRYLKER